MRSWKKLFIISIITSILTIFGILYFTVGKSSVRYLVKLSPAIILSIVLLHFLSIVMASFKLTVLSKSTGYKVNVFKSLKIVMASGFLAAITPSQMGGEPLRIKMLHDEGIESGEATAIVFGERVMDALFFLMAAPIILMLFRTYTMMGNPTDYIAGGAVFTLLLFLIIWFGVMRPEKLKSLVVWLADRLERFMKKPEEKESMVEKINYEIDNFGRSFRDIVRKKGFFVLALFFTTLLWLLDFSIPSVIMMGFGLKPMWAYSISAQIIITLLAMMPITPGSSGVVEMGMLGLYAACVPSGIIGVFILLWRLSTYYFNLVIGGAVSVKVIHAYGGEKDGNGDKSKGS